MRVLVVEDEVRLAENVAAGLRESSGYAVDIANDGADALLLTQTTSYDLIVLDLMIPKMNGETFLRQVRAARVNTPVLVLTAVIGKEKIIEMLNSGADDYMTKPFDLGELVARARALVRRGKGVSEPLLQVGSLQIQTAHQTVSHGTREVELSPTEYRILEYLMFRPRVIVSKRELLEHLYDFTWEHHSNVVEAHVSNLRRKLRAVTDSDVLETLRGRGYRLANIP